MKRWLCGLAASLFSLVVHGADLDADTQRDLKYMLEHDCGSCHGMQLKGGLGPPLTPTALENYPVDFVAGVILHGRGGTAMPPWRDLLGVDEARWLAEYLLKGGAQ